MDPELSPQPRPLHHPRSDRMGSTAPVQARPSSAPGFWRCSVRATNVALARSWHSANGMTTTAGAGRPARRWVPPGRRFGRFAPFPEFHEGGRRKGRVRAGKLLFKLGLAAPIQRLLLHQSGRSGSRYLSSGCGSPNQTKASASAFNWLRIGPDVRAKGPWSAPS
jgi:hypothetical protein